ncbi:MAG: hypothetical protein DGJ47_001176 [Rickettsiaceae bacterium]
MEKILSITANIADEISTDSIFNDLYKNNQIDDGDIEMSGQIPYSTDVKYIEME